MEPRPAEEHRCKVQVGSAFGVGRTALLVCCGFCPAVVNLVCSLSLSHCACCASGAAFTHPEARRRTSPDKRAVASAADIEHQEYITIGSEWKHRAEKLQDEPVRQARYYAECVYFFVKALAVKSGDVNRLLKQTEALFRKMLRFNCFDVKSNPNRKVALLTGLLQRLRAVLLILKYRTSGKSLSAAMLFNEVHQHFKPFRESSDPSGGTVEVEASVMRNTSFLLEQMADFHSAVNLWRTASKANASEVLKKIAGGEEFDMCSSLEDAEKFTRAFLDIVQQMAS